MRKTTLFAGCLAFLMSLLSGGVYARNTRQAVSPVVTSCYDRLSLLHDARRTANDWPLYATISFKRWQIETNCARGATAVLASSFYASAIFDLQVAVSAARDAGAEKHFIQWRTMMFDLLDANEYRSSRYVGGDRGLVAYYFGRFCDAQKPELTEWPDRGRLGIDWKTWHQHCDAVEAARTH